MSPQNKPSPRPARDRRGAVRHEFVPLSPAQVKVLTLLAGSRTPQVAGVVGMYVWGTDRHQLVAGKVLCSLERHGLVVKFDGAWVVTPLGRTTLKKDQEGRTA